MITLNDMKYIYIFLKSTSIYWRKNIKNWIFVVHVPWLQETCVNVSNKSMYCNTVTISTKLLNTSPSAVTCKSVSIIRSLGQMRNLYEGVTWAPIKLYLPGAYTSALWQWYRCLLASYEAFTLTCLTSGANELLADDASWQLTRACIE